MKSLFKKTSSFLAFFVCLISSTFAQLPDSKGTDFHVAFPPNYSSGARLELFISSESVSVVTLTSAHTGFSHTVTTVPGTVSTVSLPNSFEVTNYQTVQDKGIHIVSDNEVTVYGLNAIRYSTDAFMGLPTDILGTEYIISSYKGLGASYPSMATVVGAEDGTVVTFIPTNAVGSNAAGVPFSVTVNKGQTYAIAATTGARDLTGTIITSSKPLAVYGSVKCTNVPSNCSACDHVVEQMTPVSSWGKSFVTAPLASRKNGDIFRFIASVDGTSITVNGSVVATINRGQFHERLITGNAEITSTEPILVAQFSRGQSCDGVVADPFMMLIPPYEQFLASYTIATPASGFSKHFINLVVPQIAIGDVKLDGVVIPAGRFTAVGTSGFYTAQLTVTAGSHTIDGNYPVGVHSYGFGSYDSYGYAGGQSLSPIGFVNSISLSPANGGSSEVATQHCVEATVLDQFSNAVEGVRVDFNVTGANTLTGFGFTNASGVAQYCYNGAATGNDNVVATTGSLTSNTGVKEWTCASIATDVSGSVCVGGSDNQISFGAVSGGVAPYTYSTDNGATFGSSSTVTGLGYGTYVVVVKDAANCLSTAKDVVLQDVVPPTAVCQNVSVQLDANGSYALTAVEVDNGSTDNCTLASLSLSPSSFTCDNTGSNSVILTATDNSGNSSTCTAEITVLDDTNPCCEGPVAIAKDITISLDNNGVATLSAAQVDNGSTADCGLQSMTVSSTSFTCDDMGEHTVTLTVTDVNGVVSTSTSVVTVIDDTKPVLVCQNVTRVLDATGHLQFNPLVDGAVVSRTDNCKTKGHVGFTGPKHYYCPQVGDHNITIYQQDESNNQTSCQVVLTIVDDIAPVALCKDITVQLDASGNASIVAADVDGGSSDVCEVSLSIDNDQFTCANVGANNVVLTATDPSGNASSCTAVVTVEDNVAPNAIGQDLALELDEAGIVTITAADVDNGSNDNCGIASLSITPNVFTCANVGDNVVLLTATDVNGNVSTAIVNANVSDVTAPIAIAQDLVVELDANGFASITAADADNGSNDFCGIASIEVSPSEFDCSVTGTNVATLTATDVNGNVSTVEFNVEVKDVIAPSIVCPSTVVVCDEQAAVWEEPYTDDNCSVVSVVSDFNSGTIFPVGTSTVSYVVTDASGNTAECSFDVVVNALPEVSITQSEQDGFCQGGAIVMTANSETAESYLWDDGAVTKSNNAYSSGTYEVTVTDVNGCSQSATTIVDYKQTELLSNYVILAKTRFHLYEDHISCGGAGIMEAGGISQIYGGPVNQFKSPFTVSPWYANHTIKMEPFASTWFDIDNVVDGNSNVNLPAFEATNNSGHAGNIYVYPGQTVVLTQSKYGIVNVFAGGTLIIDNADIHMESLTTGYGGADVIFNKCSTKLHIKTTWTSYPDVQFNADGKSVVVFIGPDQWNGFDRTYFWGGNAVINASIYTKGLIRTYNMGPGKIMEMNGLYIANEIYTMGNVEWSCATTCATDCGEESNKRDEFVEGLQDGSAEAPSSEVAEVVEIDMFPNPSKGLITLGNVETFKTIKFFDAKGSLVKEVLNAKGAQMLQVSMDDQANGVYTVVFTGSASVQQAKVVITK